MTTPVITGMHSDSVSDSVSSMAERRRDKGQGGLYQRHDHPTCPPLVDGVRVEHRCRGRWVGTVEVTIDGKRRRKTVYGRTKKAAQVAQAKANRAKEDGTLITTSPTVAAWMAEWLKKKRRPPRPLKPQTWNGYESKSRTYIVPTLGKRRLGDVKPQHIEAMYDDMRSRGLAESTVRQTHAILQKALKDAVRLGHLGVSPMAKVQPPGTETGERDQFTLEQAMAALKAAGDSARWWLALFYGMRQGEVLGMDWRFVDWGAHVFLVEETRQNNYRGDDSGAILGDPKSRASRRPLPLLPWIEARLRLLWEASGCPAAGLVFPGEDGKPMDPKRDWSDWSEFIAAAGLPHIALHAARNTASSLMEAADIPDRVVAQILGQSQVRTTHGYQKAELARVRGYMERFGVMLELDG